VTRALRPHPQQLLLLQGVMVLQSAWILPVDCVQPGFTRCQETWWGRCACLFVCLCAVLVSSACCGGL
jgi:hypothetical protein